MRPTMKAIADEAGCSVMTVSLALRDHPRISKETKAKVLKVSKRLGYKPNPLVSTLMTHIRSTKPVNYQSNLAFFCYRQVWRLHWVQSHLFKGIKQRAEDLGFFIDTFWLDDTEDKPRSLTNVLRSRNIQGVIVAPLPETRAFEELDWQEWSVAAIGNTILKPRINCATHHQYHGMSLIFQTLQAKGYRRIGLALDRFVDDKVDRTWSSCMAGWQLRLPPKDRVPILLGEMSQAKLLPWMKKWQPEVVIGLDGLLDCLQKANLRIPQDVAFAHLSLPSIFSHRKLSGLDQNWDLAGAAAVDSVVAQIHRNERGIPEIPKTLMVEGRWVEGETAPGL